MCVPAIKALVKAGAEYQSRTLAFVLEFGKRDNMTADERARFISALKMVVKLGRGANVDIGKCDPLHQIRDREALEILVWGGVGIDEKGTYPHSPLSHYLGASDEGREPDYDVVEGFISLGADPNDLDLEDFTPFLYYVRWQRPEPRMIDLLLRAGADETIAMKAINRSHDKERSRAVSRLVKNAPADRRWRRRSLILMCIARHNRDFVPMKPIVLSDPWTRVAASLLKMGSGGGTEDMFRIIVGYL